MDDIKNNFSDSTQSDENISVTNNNSTDENISMEELLKNNVGTKEGHLHEGDIAEGIFAGRTSEGYLFDIGYKQEGIVPLSENIPEEILNSSTPIKLRIVKHSTADFAEGDNPLLSWRSVMMEETLAALKTAYQNRSPVKGIIIKKIKGGYIVNIGDAGIPAFLPGTHLSITKRGTQQVSKHIDCIILEMKDKIAPTENQNLGDSSNIVVSEREAEKILREKAIEEFFKSKSVGDIVEGTITRITKFGAFADVGGADALIHISDISWTPVEKIEDFLKIGQKVKSRITAMDTTTRKISLSIKDLADNPWNNIDGKYSVGDIISVTVRNFVNFGVFCEIESGIDGLLHISEVDWKNPNPVMSSLFKKGDVIKVKIIAIDIAKRKISLSVKRLTPNPWEKLSNEISVGKNVEGVISRLTPFGAIVKVGDAVEGTLHVKNLDWVKKISDPSEILKPGERMTLNVIEFKPSEQRLELSLKHTKPNPFQKYKRKTVVEFVVSKVIPAGAFGVIIEDGIEVFVPRAELARHKTEDITTIVKPGDKLKGLVIESDELKKKIEISVRKYDISEEKKLLAKYSSDKPRPKLLDILSETE